MACRTPKTCSRECGLLHPGDAGFIPMLCQGGNACYRRVSSCTFYHEDEIASLGLPQSLHERCMTAIRHHPTHSSLWRSTPKELDDAQRSYGKYCFHFLRSTTPWEWSPPGAKSPRIEPRDNGMYYAGFHDGSQAARRVAVSGGLLSYKEPTTEEIRTYYRGFNDGLRS